MALRILLGNPPRNPFGAKLVRKKLLLNPRIGSTGRGPGRSPPPIARRLARDVDQLLAPAVGVAALAGGMHEQSCPTVSNRARAAGSGFVIGTPSAAPKCACKAASRTLRTFSRLPFRKHTLTILIRSLVLVRGAEMNCLLRASLLDMVEDVNRGDGGHHKHLPRRKLGGQTGNRPAKNAV